MHSRKLLLVTFSLVAGLVSRAADPLEETASQATAEYVERLQAATAELTTTRTRIAAERTPIAEETRAIEAKIAALESELLRLETLHANGAETRQLLRREADEKARVLGYLLNQAQETMKVMEDSLLPGERPAWADRMTALRHDLDAAAPRTGEPIAFAVATFAADRAARQLGGYTVKGRAVAEGDSSILNGTFLFLGPAAYFQADGGNPIGIAGWRRESDWPMVQTIKGWSASTAGAAFQQGNGVVALDASGGKALTLHNSSSSFIDQVRKGGLVSLAILAVGVLALIISIQKLLDFRRLAVDEAAAVKPILAHISRGAYEEAAEAVQMLKTTTRELFTLGLRHRLKPRALLEEHLESFVLQQRMLQERRLPLLAVIATAGPLLGLLGTVTGMIKTFTLITVLGTGSAGKLSAGISEALIATKFGLMVAIPALVIHGFLSQRIQKHLSMLDRYALEIATACEEGRREANPQEAGRP
jgi:biopolymer transport protein ExbB